MATKNRRVEVDAALTYVFLKKIMTPITSMRAFQLKLIDNSGRIIKEPQTQAEKESLTLLDRVVLKLKRLLGTRLTSLYQFIYLQTLNSDVYNNLSVMGSVQQKVEVKRITKDFKRLMEEHEISMEDLNYLMLEDNQDD